MSVQEGAPIPQQPAAEVHRVKSDQEIAAQVTRIAGKLALRAEYVDSPDISLTRTYGQDLGVNVKFQAEGSSDKMNDEGLSLEIKSGDRMNYANAHTANLSKQAGSSKVRVHAERRGTLNNYGTYFKSESGSRELRDEHAVSAAASMLSEARNKLARAKLAKPAGLDDLLKR